MLHSKARHKAFEHDNATSAFAERWGLIIDVIGQGEGNHSNMTV
jgi:hypothetical protein